MSQSHTTLLKKQPLHSDVSLVHSFLQARVVCFVAHLLQSMDDARVRVLGPLGSLITAFGGVDDDSRDDTARSLS